MRQGSTSWFFSLLSRQNLLRIWMLLLRFLRMLIAPSVLDANFQNFQSEIDSIATSDRIHLDIMDGQYVPNISFGPPVFKQIDFSIPIEAHLMVDNPQNFFDMFIELGCMGITFHIENTGPDFALVYLEDLKKRGIKAGICVDGDTDVSVLNADILNVADQVLLMSVKAGFGGQSFREEVYDKITWLRDQGFDGEIEIDGGVNTENAPKLAEAGADIVVIGSALMKQPTQQRGEIIAQIQSI